MQFLIVIPARRHSTRLPEKLLLAETGRPLLAHTIEAARKALNEADGSRVWVACDDQDLANVARQAGANAVMVTEYCESGTIRICRALPELPPTDLIVNLQADEPEMPADWITECVSALKRDPQADVATVAVPLADGAPEIDDPNTVKVVLDNNDCAMYFSRAPIPHVRAGAAPPSPRALHHVGLYAYRTQFLRNFDALPPSNLEPAECLEQLRFLQAGTRIKVVIPSRTDYQVQGIDTQDDYRAFVNRHHTAAQ